jgi:hypothetical protein
LHNANGQSFTLNYDTENRLVSVTGAATANFYYDADGKQVKSIVNGVTTYYVGQHYEKKGTTVTKYYFAGATRLAVRTNGALSYLLGDHPSTTLRTSLGSSSVTTNASGVKTGFKRKVTELSLVLYLQMARSIKCWILLNANALSGFTSSIFLREYISPPPKMCRDWLHRGGRLPRWLRLPAM